MPIKLFFAALLVFSHAVADAKAPVWKVSKGDESLYIGGSIHVLSEDDYPLPDAFYRAFSDAQLIVFETDLEAAKSADMRSKLKPVMLLPEGKTLKTTLKEDTYQRLQTFMAERGLPLPVFERFSAAGLNLTLVVLELQRLGITEADGVETRFGKRANDADKEMIGLETIDEQIGFVQKLNDLDPDMLIESTIRDVGNLAQEFPALLRAWRAGDMEELDRLAGQKMLQEAPQMYQFMLVDRNQNWIEPIKQMLSTAETEFVLVGALHLAGKDSVLELLKHEGYLIEQLD